MASYRRSRNNLIVHFIYSDLTEREKKAVNEAMERYNSKEISFAPGLQKNYTNPSQFFQDVIRRYGWTAV